MFALLKKEVFNFFDTLTGYLVLITYLGTTSFLIWIYPSDEVNIFNHGIASLETFFQISPWLLLFLMTATTFNSISDELKNGTIEILFTKPIKNYQIVLGKFFASQIILFLSLIPTLIYYFSISELASPKGNVDLEATIGSYIGIFILGSMFASIGTFTSSITKNSIVAFLYSILIGFFIYKGFEIASDFGAYFNMEFLEFFGANFHFNALTRGVIDSRNIIYFISIILFFLYLTENILNSYKT